LVASMMCNALRADKLVLDKILLTGALSASHQPHSPI
jgi:hypothetical protein